MPPRTPKRENTESRTNAPPPAPATILAATPVPSVGSLVPCPLVSLLYYYSWNFSCFITTPEETLNSRLSAGGTVPGVCLSM